MPPPKPKANAKSKAAAAASAAAALARSPAEEAEAALLRLQCAELARKRAREAAAAERLDEERAQLRAQWAAAKQDVAAAQQALQEREGERKAAAHAAALEQLDAQQRITQLLGEHAAAASEVAIKGQALAVQEHQERDRKAEGALLAQRRALKATLLEMEAAHDGHCKALRLEQDRAQSEARGEFERRMRELSVVFEEAQTRLRDEAGRAREDEVRALEAAMDAQVASLTAASAAALADIKLYFNGITHSNLDLVKSLKLELDELRKREAADERVMYAVASENKKMSDPMKQVLSEIQRLRGIREQYRADLDALAAVKAQTARASGAHEDLKWEHELLTQRMARLGSDRDALAARFDAAIHEVHKRAALRRLSLVEQLRGASSAAAATTTTTTTKAPVGEGASSLAAADVGCRAAPRLQQLGASADLDPGL